MKFTCLQENLSRTLGVVAKAVPAKAPLPILSNVLLMTEGGRLKISATDLDTSITTYVGGSVEEEGGITVPAKLLKDFVSNLSPDTLVMESEKDVLRITSGKSKGTFNGISEADYPDIPALSDDLPALEIDPSVFTSIVNSVAYAAALSGSQPVFEGVLLNYSGGVLAAVASDGFRLSERVVDLGGELDAFSVVVPAKALLDVSRIFSGSNEPVKFALNEVENLTLFESEDTCVSTRVLDGSFPDYKRVIPKETMLHAELLSAELLEAVKLASIFSKDIGSSIRIIFEPEGMVSLRASSQESGEHHSQFEATIEGESMEIVVNSKYLLDYLSNSSFEKLIFETSGVAKPCVLKPVEGEGFLHIIMPMQTQG